MDKETIVQLLADGAISNKVAERYFPELKESEGEKIRKEILDYIDRSTGCKRWVAWLEKQGEPIDEEKVLMGARKDVALSIMNFLDRCTLGMCLSGMERADLEDAVVNSDWSKVYDYMKMKLEKQREKPQGKSALESIKEEKVDNANKIEPKDYSSIDPHFFKPTDKVEPKFKVGDKIRRKTPSSCDKDMQVARIEKDYYICNHIGKFSSEVVPFSKQSGYELIEQKPAAWSEDDEIRHKNTLDDLEGFLEYIKQRPSHEISEYSLMSKDSMLTAIQKDIGWFKSLKERVQPQITWKPSDKQMELLKEACDRHWEPDGLDPLYMLYQDLKKIKEE